MKIQYAGPRPIISEHGVSFKDGKEDKYVYLQIGVQLLLALDNDYEKQHKYSHKATKKEYSDKELLNIMLTYEPNLQKDQKQEIQSYSKHLDEEIESVQQSVLGDVEKRTMINNLKIMKEYRIQRAINKIYYIHCIDEIVHIIKQKQIKEIQTPFHERYWHVLQTIQGQISSLKSPIQTELKVDHDENNNLLAHLIIGGY